jgi:hypothetical protein
MGKIKPVSPAALIAGITFGNDTVLNSVLQKITEEFDFIYIIN